LHSLFGEGLGAKIRDASLHPLLAPTFIGQTAIGGFELAVHFGGCSREGIFDVGGFVGNDEWLMTFCAGFEDASFALWAWFFGAFVAGEVNLDAGEEGIESLKEVVDIGSDSIGEFGVHRDIVIAVDLNLHEHLLITRPATFDAPEHCSAAYRE
jgi:hypothetical protein